MRLRRATPARPFWMTPEEMARLHGQSFTPGWSAQSFADLCADPRSVVVTAPQGFALAQSALDDADLLTLVVAPDARGRGLGRGLLARLETRLGHVGVHRLFLEVAADNAPAMALYRATGFSEVGRRKGYYPGPDGATDAVVMCKHLLDAQPSRRRASKD